MNLLLEFYGMYGKEFRSVFRVIFPYFSRTYELFPVLRIDPPVGARGRSPKGAFPLNKVFIYKSMNLLGFLYGKGYGIHTESILSQRSK